MLYPLNIELKNRPCCVVGGGHVALRKVRALLAAEALVTVIAPQAIAGLEALYKAGQINWWQVEFRPDTNFADGTFLVICATDRPEINKMAAELAKKNGLIVNAPAQPELSDFFVPASLRRGELLITASTGGLSPALSRLIREELAKIYPESLGIWLERLSALREEMKKELPDSLSREKFWRFALTKNVLDLVRTGHLGQAEAELRNAIDSFRAEP